MTPTQDIFIILTANEAPAIVRFDQIASVSREPDRDGIPGKTVVAGVAGAFLLLVDESPEHVLERLICTLRV